MALPGAGRGDAEKERAAEAARRARFRSGVAAVSLEDLAVARMAYTDTLEKAVMIASGEIPVDPLNRAEHAADLLRRLEPRRLHFEALKARYEDQERHAAAERASESLKTQTELTRQQTEAVVEQAKLAARQTAAADRQADAAAVQASAARRSVWIAVAVGLAVAVQTYNGCHAASSWIPAADHPSTSAR